MAFSKKIKSNTLKNSLGIFVFRIMGMLLAYAANIFIAQKFGKEVYGNFATSLTILQILGALACLGLTELVIKFTADVNHSHNGIPKNAFFKSSLILVSVSSLALALILFFSADIISIQVFKEKTLIDFIKSLAIFLPFYSLHFIITSYWQGSRQFTKYGLFRFALPYIIFFVGFFLFNEKTNNVFLFYMLSFPIMALVELAVSHKIIFSNVKKQLTHSALLQVSYPMMLSSIILFSLSWLDIIMLGILKNQAYVGEYQAAFKLASVIMMVIMVTNIVIAPNISKMFSEDKTKDMFAFVKKVTRYITLTALLLSIPFLFFPKTIMEFTFGNEFKSAGLVLLILTISNLINTSLGPVDLVMNMTKHQKTFQNIVLISIVLKIAISYFLIQNFETMGAAFATLLITILLNLSCNLFFQKEYGKNTSFL